MASVTTSSSSNTPQYDVAGDVETEDIWFDAPEPESFFTAWEGPIHDWPTKAQREWLAVINIISTAFCASRPAASDCNRQKHMPLLVGNKFVGNLVRRRLLPGSTRPSAPAEDADMPSPAAADGDHAKQRQHQPAAEPEAARPGIPKEHASEAPRKEGDAQYTASDDGRSVDEEHRGPEADVEPTALEEESAAFEHFAESAVGEEIAADWQESENLELGEAKEDDAERTGGLEPLEANAVASTAEHDSEIVEPSQDAAPMSFAADDTPAVVAIISEAADVTEEHDEPADVEMAVLLPDLHAAVVDQAAASYAGDAEQGDDMEIDAREDSEMADADDIPAVKAEDEAIAAAGMILKPSHAPEVAMEDYERVEAYGWMPEIPVAQETRSADTRVIETTWAVAQIKDAEMGDVVEETPMPMPSVKLPGLFGNILTHYPVYNPATPVSSVAAPSDEQPKEASIAQDTAAIAESIEKIDSREEQAIPAANASIREPSLERANPAESDATPALSAPSGQKSLEGLDLADSDAVIMSWISEMSLKWKALIGTYYARTLDLNDEFIRASFENLTTRFEKIVKRGSGLDKSQRRSWLSSRIGPTTAGSVKNLARTVHSGAKPMAAENDDLPYLETLYTSCAAISELQYKFDSPSSKPATGPAPSGSASGKQSAPQTPAERRDERLYPTEHNQPLEAKANTKRGWTKATLHVFLRSWIDLNYDSLEELIRLEEEGDEDDILKGLRAPATQLMLEHARQRIKQITDFALVDGIWEEEKVGVPATKEVREHAQALRRSLRDVVYFYEDESPALKDLNHALEEVIEHTDP